MKRACVLLADGFEETEAVAVIDVLRRGEIKVEVLGVEGKKVTGAHDIVIEADALVPHMAGAGNLYSVEFFGECARRLKPRAAGVRAPCLQ